jgi:uncharacterized protein DUF2568
VIGAANLALRFVCELAALIALAWWGFSLGNVGGVLVGLVVAVAAAGLWGAFIAPRARRRLADPARFLLELVVFGAATAALFALDHAVLAVVFAICAVVTAALTRVWPEPQAAGPRS